MNVNNFAQYQMDGKYHLKILWDFGESVEWKQVETIFETNIQATISGLCLIYIRFKYNNLLNYKSISLI